MSPKVVKLQILIWSLNPALGAIGDKFMFGNAIQLNHIIGIGLVIASVFLVSVYHDD